MWFGLAVFLSVPLFGTLTAMARNLDDPQAQPVALIRNTDGPDEAIQGLYVTETDDRVYFATLATEGCGDKIVGHSGRLLWVPRSEVVAMSIGPLEDVADARTTALEMAYALTPAVETPAGDHVSLTTGEERAEAAKQPKAKAEGTGTDQRLENVGVAVRPNFGLGLRLVPEDASAGDVVTLRMSKPNREVEGFGKTREGRTLRLGGVPVPILREKVRFAKESEFVKTEEGKILPLDKSGLYVRGSDGLVPIDQGPDNPRARFVRLAVNSGVKGPAVDGPHPGVYLEVDGEDQTRLAEDQEVSYANGDSALIEPRLLRQAWHEDHIKFRVPDNASSGVVTVECEQAGGAAAAAGRPAAGRAHRGADDPGLAAGRLRRPPLERRQRQDRLQALDGRRPPPGPQQAGRRRAAAPAGRLCGGPDRDRRRRPVRHRLAAHPAPARGSDALRRRGIRAPGGDAARSPGPARSGLTRGARSGGVRRGSRGRRGPAAGLRPEGRRSGARLAHAREDRFAR